MSIPRRRGFKVAWMFLSAAIGAYAHGEPSIDLEFGVGLPPGSSV